MSTTPRYLRIGFVYGSIALANPLFGDGLGLRSEGISFPDGTIQTTAAAEVAFPKAWPEYCEFSVDLNPGENVPLVCRSDVNAPGGDWGPANGGVPVEHWFLVTDVHLYSTTGSDVAALRLSQIREGLDHGIRRFRVDPSGFTRVFSYRAPLIQLAAGDYLMLGNDSDQQIALEGAILGFLTSQPDLILH